MDKDALRVSYPGHDVLAAVDRYLIFDSRRRAARYREKITISTGSASGWQTRMLAKPFTGEPFNVFRFGSGDSYIHINATMKLYGGSFPSTGAMVRTKKDRIEWVVSQDPWKNNTLICYLWDWNR